MSYREPIKRVEHKEAVVSYAPGKYKELKRTAELLRDERWKREASGREALVPLLLEQIPGVKESEFWRGFKGDPKIDPDTGKSQTMNEAISGEYEKDPRHQYEQKMMDMLGIEAKRTAQNDDHMWAGNTRIPPMSEEGESEMQDAFGPKPDLQTPFKEVGNCSGCGEKFEPIEGKSNPLDWEGRRDPKGRDKYKCPGCGSETGHLA